MLEELQKMIEEFLSNQEGVEVVKFTPSVVSTRRFIGVETENGESFLLQIDKA